MQAQYMQLKWTQLGADAPLILAKDEATCFAASGKLHALGCRAGTVHVLDFEGNKIRELDKQTSRVTGIALSSNMEAVATGSEDGSIKVQNVTDSTGGWHSRVAGTITCLAVPPISSDRLDEVAVGYEPGIFSVVRKTWLPMGSEQVVRRNESKVHDILWLEGALLWATDAGVAACQVTGRYPSTPLPKPHNAGANACSLARVTPDVALVAWPHAVQVVSLLRKRGRLAATVALTALQTFSVPYRVHGIAPFGQNIALLADVSAAACRPMPSDLHEQSATDIDVDAAEEAPAVGSPRVSATSPTAGTQEVQQKPPEDTISQPMAEEESGNAEATQLAISEGPPAPESVAPPSPGASEGQGKQSESAAASLDIPDEAVEEGAAQEETAAEPVAEGLQGYDSSDAGMDQDDALQSPKVLGPPFSEGGGGEAGGASPPQGLGQRPPRLRLPLPGGIRTPRSAILTPSAADEEDSGKSRLQLRVVTTSGEELTADDLDVQYDGPPGVCMLTCWYPEQYGELMQEKLPEMPATPRTPRTGPPKEATSTPTPSPAGPKPDPTPEAAAAAAAASAVAAPDKWWQDSDEPLYLVVTGDTVVVGRPCDADDQVLYLLRLENYAAAMLVAADAPYVRPETMEECRSAYLKHLLDTGDAAGAAQWATEHLGKDKDAWERLVFMFAQREQLPALGRHVPVSPRLSKLAYTAVASAYVPLEQNHAELAQLLHRWPQSLLNDIADEVTQTIYHRIKQGSEPPSVDIQRALARLLDIQKEYRQALDIWLSIADPCVFDHINHHPDLYEAAGRGAAQLMVVDAERAINMLVEHHDKVDANEVITQVRARLDSAPQEEVPQWRQRLCKYLHSLFLKNRKAPHRFHDLQVELYAEYAPEQLLPFLQSSKQYTKEAALQVCKDRELVREQVFILGRLNRASEALQLIISTLHDLPQAIDFVSNHPELWDELLRLVVRDAELTGELLDTVGGQVDPLRVIQAIPDDLEIPNLTQRLSALMKRFRTTVHLKKLCNNIIDQDCIAIAERLMHRAQQPLPKVHMWDSKRECWELYDTTTGVSQPCDPPQIPPNAATFKPPTHTHNLGMRTQVAAHMSRNLDSLQVREGGTLNIDGMHAIVEHEAQQLVRQAAAAVHLAPSTGGLTVWTTEM